jgi:hypothetical protein
MSIMALEDTPLQYFIFPTMRKRNVEDAQTCELVFYNCHSLLGPEITYGKVYLQRYFCGIY